jgi:hypothetical protein
MLLRDVTPGVAIARIDASVATADDFIFGSNTAAPIQICEVYLRVVGQLSTIRYVGVWADVGVAVRGLFSCVSNAVVFHVAWVHAPPFLVFCQDFSKILLYWDCEIQ